MNWWDDGANAIAFSRGNLGFVVINGEAFAVSNPKLPTGLAPGKYCDVLVGGVSTVTPGTCAGQLITVDSNGNASVNLATQTGLVLQAGVSVP
jgi:alpha-amylase